jgi:sugar lactone lactonase YvrE
MTLRWQLALWFMVSVAAPTGASLADTQLVDAAAAYPEGPLWRDGKLLYVEYAGSGIKAWDGKQITSYWSGAHCGASGLIDYRHHHLLVACYDANTLVELDETGTLIRTIDKDAAGKPLLDPTISPRIAAAESMCPPPVSMI